MHARIRMIGVILAAVAWIATLTLPLYASASSDGSQGTATLIEVNGWGGAVPGLLLVTFALGVWLAPHMMVRWLFLALFLALTALGLASIGMFFLPAALALIIGVSMDRGESAAPA